MGSSGLCPSPLGGSRRRVRFIRAAAAAVAVVVAAVAAAEEMWATRGLAVALALSVLPNSRALRPGDCEGTGGGGQAALNPTEPRGRGLILAGSAGARASELLTGPRNGLV